MRFDIFTRDFIETEKNPDKLALAGADKDLTWRELKNLCDRICNSLAQAAIPSGHPVLVYGNKEVFFLAAILSCYRMEFPFVPVTAEFPLKRIEKIIAATKSHAVIHCGSIDFPIDIVINENGFTRNMISNFSVFPGAAYVLFTSGSTGEPKGICISQQNLSDFAVWFEAKFPVNENTVCMNQASFLFDISLADLLGTLHSGGTLVCNTNGMLANGTFFERLNKYKANYWNSTPSFLSYTLANKDFTAENYPNLSCFTLSGEELPVKTASALHKRFPGAKIINAYGPTETTIFASSVEITSQMLSGTKLPVAKSSELELTVEEGEIVIAKKVGRYLNGTPAEKQFRTGDLAFEENGYIYFAGRKDDQIKLNGYRIELDEIKNALEECDGVERAECVALRSAEKVQRLLAFTVPQLNRSLSGEKLKEELAGRLPQYMIPSEIILINQLPHTNSFKVDRNKLLEYYLNR